MILSPKQGQSLFSADLLSAFGSGDIKQSRSGSYEYKYSSVLFCGLLLSQCSVRKLDSFADFVVQSYILDRYEVDN